MVPTGNEPLTEAPSTLGAKPENGSNGGAERPATAMSGVQGEGNYEAARAFNEAERKFVASGKVAAAARAAAPASEAERQEMISAEQEGRRRAKEEGPALTKPWPSSTTLRLPRKDAVRKQG